MLNANSAMGYKLRDDARSHDTYSKNILDVEASTESVTKRLAEGRAKRPNSMRNLIFMNNLELAQIMYCRGDDFTDIQLPVCKAIDYLIHESNPDSAKGVYTNLLDIVSLVILLKMPGNLFSELKNIVDQCDERDQVLDHLISHGAKYKDGEAGQTAMMTYTDLNRAIKCSDEVVDKNTCVEYLLSYMNGVWHEKQLMSGNLKRRANPDAPYAGVFCFRVAAMAYVNNLDDTKLRESKYYPIDVADHVRSC